MKASKLLCSVDPPRQSGPYDWTYPAYGKICAPTDLTWYAAGPNTAQSTSYPLMDVPRPVPTFSDVSRLLQSSPALRGVLGGINGLLAAAIFSKKGDRVKNSAIGATSGAVLAAIPSISSPALLGVLSGLLVAKWK